VISKKITLTEQTVGRIEQMISEKGLRAGEVFTTEGKLIKKLGVSRQIVREAISRLRAIGKVQSRQCVGLVVSEPDPVKLFGKALNSIVIEDMELQQLAELRYVLETGAIELSAKRATEEELAEISRLANTYTPTTPSTSGISFDKVESDFHQLILKATHSEIVVKMHSIISAYFDRGAKEMTGWHSHEINEKEAWEHRAIAEALSERNAERARALLTGHLNTLLVPVKK